VTSGIGMTSRFTTVNGVGVAHSIRGEGPPLVLVMGYRLNSTAWPATFIDQLAQHFTVISLDNRGTGLSDKPANGYAIENMARDVCGLLDHLGIAQVSMLGYSMGGAIAQEFVRQVPERISRLILCATMAGGHGATYARASVVAVMRDLDGLSPEQVARRIWNVTYSPGYLERHRKLAEEQMLREIASPTPLHAADLQFQAFAEFDGSKNLTNIRCPTLVLTGELDELISPENSRKIAHLILSAKLVVIPGCGHRVLWEATEECLSFILQFLASRDEEFTMATPTQVDGCISSLLSGLPFPPAELLTRWPSMLASAALDALIATRQSMMMGSASRFGDGKPVVLIPQFLGSDLAMLPLSAWLKALGYRPAVAGIVLNFSDASSERALSRLVHDVTARISRKAILITHSSGMPLALRVAERQRERVSDIVVFDSLHQPSSSSDVRVHYLSTGFSVLPAIMELRRLLRNIGIELIGERASRTEIADVEPTAGALP
jgi:pimeloyl-ACP methyl ester carboxylesterase